MYVDCYAGSTFSGKNISRKIDCLINYMTHTFPYQDKLIIMPDRGVKFMPIIIFTFLNYHIVRLNNNFALCKLRQKFVTDVLCD